MLTTKEPNYPTSSGMPETEEQLNIFIDWVHQNTQPDTVTNCWNWNGAADKNTNVARYKNGSAATYIFKIINRIPDNNPGRIFRTCRNNLCVNPQHSRVAVGPRTKAKVRLEETLGGALLTPSQFEEVKGLLERNLVEMVVKEIQQGVAKEIHAVEKTIVDGVVAELIRIRFDEMVAKAIRGGGK
jgi:hypothetical protein